MGARFAPNIPLARKSFWTHPMELLGDVGHVDLDSVCLAIVLILMQDRCTVSAECMIGSEVIWDTPDGTPR